MTIYEGNSNPSNELQIQQPATTLLFKLTKNTPVDRPDQFFADDYAGNGDKLRLMYSPPGGGGQKQLIALERVFPIAIDGTVGENHMYFYKDANGKITGCDFCIEVGAGGSLPLDQNAYLSLFTQFSDVKTLGIYTIDTKMHSTLAYQYTFENIEAGQLKSINMTGVTQILLPKDLDTIVLVYPDKTVNMTSTEAAMFSRVINNIQGFMGKVMSRTVSIDGANYAQDLGFEADGTYSGDAFFNSMGTDGLLEIRVKCPHRDRIMLKRPIDPTA